MIIIISQVKSENLNCDFAAVITKKDRKLKCKIYFHFK